MVVVVVVVVVVALCRNLLFPAGVNNGDTAPLPTALADSCAVFRFKVC